MRIVTRSAAAVILAVLGAGADEPAAKERAAEDRAEGGFAAEPEALRRPMSRRTIQFPGRPTAPLEDNPEAIAAAVRDLDSRDETVRGAARSKLFWLGEKAVPAVEKEAEGEAAIGRAEARTLLAFWAERRRIEALPFVDGLRTLYAGPVASSDQGLRAIGRKGDPARRVVAMPLTDSFPAANTLTVIVDLEAPTEFGLDELCRGRLVRIMNTAKEPVTLTTRGDRLQLGLEAIGTDGEWHPVEMKPAELAALPAGEATLKAQEEWRIEAPVYIGNHKTEMRYRLTGLATGDVVSSTFKASIDPALLLPISKD